MPPCTVSFAFLPLFICAEAYFFVSLYRCIFYSLFSSHLNIHNMPRPSVYSPPARPLLFSRSLSVFYSIQYLTNPENVFRLLLPTQSNKLREMRILSIILNLYRNFANKLKSTTFDSCTQPLTDTQLRCLGKYDH